MRKIPSCPAQSKLSVFWPRVSEIKHCKSCKRTENWQETQFPQSLPGKAWNAVLNSKDGSVIVLTSSPQPKPHQTGSHSSQGFPPAHADGHKAHVVLIPSRPQHGEDGTMGTGCKGDLAAQGRKDSETAASLKIGPASSCRISDFKVPSASKILMMPSE